MAPLDVDEISFVPLHANFGVRVEGVDLSRPRTPAAEACLRDAISKHDLLLFPQQQLTPEQELRAYEMFPHDAEAVAQGSFVQKLGPKLPTVPAIAVRGHNVSLEDHFGLTTDKPLTYAPNFRDTLVWHQDAVGLTETPPEVSGMYMLECPQSTEPPSSILPSGKTTSEMVSAGEFTGGETWFASMAHCYAALSEEQQQRADELKCSYARATFLFASMAANGVGRTDDIDDALAKVKADPRLSALVGSDVTTPLVERDQETDTRHLLISPNTFYTFESEGEEMPSAAARAELESLLVPYLEDPANVFRLSWQPNDLAIWRNRRLLHTSTPWAQYTQERRLFHLMFLDSDRPILAP